MKRKDLQGEREMKGEIQRDRKIKEESYRERKMKVRGRDIKPDSQRKSSEMKLENQR